MKNREIKFEYGFNSVNGIVKKVYYLYEIPFMHDKCDVWDMLPLVYVRQFTGLKDKNGVTYCQDDIVKVGERNYRLIKGAYMFELAGYWNGSQDIPSDFFSENQYSISKIIGNIHENPNLL